MKKLMIAAAIVCAAAYAQAAQYHWLGEGAAAGYQTGFDGDEVSGAAAGTTYLFLDADLSGTGGANTLRDVIIASFAAGTFDTYAGKAIASGSFTDGGFDVFSPNGLDDYTGQSVYAVLVGTSVTDWEGTTIETKGPYYNALDAYTLTKVPGTGAADIAYGDVWDSTASMGTGDNSWYGSVAPVPEPTSGLLLLLGVAGLALRRRRA